MVLLQKKEIHERRKKGMTQHLRLLLHEMAQKVDTVAPPYNGEV